MTERPRGWSAVLALVTERWHGLALMALFEYQEQQLTFDGEQFHEHTGELMMSEREAASRISDRMWEVTGTYWGYGQFYPSVRREDAEPAEIDAFVAILRDAGIEMSYQPYRRPPGHDDDDG